MAIADLAAVAFTHPHWLRKNCAAAQAQHESAAAAANLTVRSGQQQSGADATRMRRFEGAASYGAWKARRLGMDGTSVQGN